MMEYDEDITVTRGEEESVRQTEANSPVRVVLLKDIRNLKGSGACQKTSELDAGYYLVVVARYDIPFQNLGELPREAIVPELVRAGVGERLGLKAYVQKVHSDGVVRTKIPFE
jgi:hypothetical protein